MVIYEPVDSAQLKKMMPQILQHEGPVYIRLLRRNAIQIFEDTDEFTLGKGTMVCEGSDVTIVASGIMVAEAIKAADALAAEGISAEVINMHTIKPLDAEMLLKSAGKTRAVVTAENGSIINGLGGAVCEVLSENLPVPVKRVGVKDHFGEVGSTAYLQEKYGLTDKEIVAAAKAVIAMK
jgi:transketolase